MDKIPFRLNPLATSEEQDQELTFTSTGSSTIQLTKTGDPIVDGLQYKIGTGLWQNYTIDQVISLADGEYVKFKNSKKQLSTSVNDYVQFVMTGSIAASGNIQSLLGWSEKTSEYCFYRLFYDCASLTSAPELPATTMAGGCYYYMFRGCTSLTTAPELPATTMAGSCYYGMFYGCTSLTKAPELPATSLAYRCYMTMFYGCTSLEEAKDLPAETLANGCYQSMYSYCSGLIQPPIIDAKTLATECCRSMFSNCTSLTYTPYLAAETLVSGCYNRMFQACSSLEMVKTGFEGWLDDQEATTNWLQNVSSTGTFIRGQNTSSSTRDRSHIPENWSVEWKHLTIASAQGLITVTLNAYGNVDYSGLQYRKYENGAYTNWTSYPINTAVQVTSTGETIQFRNTKNTFSSSSANYFNFYVQGNASFRGWIQSLMNYQDFTTSRCYTYLFRNVNVSTRAPILNVTRLGNYCYSAMFYGDTALKYMPKLLNQYLNTSCYANMFLNCSNLDSSISELPAKYAPAGCYQSMFRNCTSLTTAPEIKAEELERISCLRMFQNDSALSSIQVHFTNWKFDDQATSGWVEGVSSTGSFTKPSSLTLIKDDDHIPNGWSVYNW